MIKVPKNDLSWQAEVVRRDSRLQQLAAAALTNNSVQALFTGEQQRIVVPPLWEHRAFAAGCCTRRS